MCLFLSGEKKRKLKKYLPSHQTVVHNPILIISVIKLYRMNMNYVPSQWMMWRDQGQNGPCSLHKSSNWKRRNWLASYWCRHLTNDIPCIFRAENITLFIGCHNLSGEIVCLGETPLWHISHLMFIIPFWLDQVV